MCVLQDRRVGAPAEEEKIGQVCLSFQHPSGFCFVRVLVSCLCAREQKQNFTEDNRGCGSEDGCSPEKEERTNDLSDIKRQTDSRASKEEEVRLSL